MIKMNFPISSFTSCDKCLQLRPSLASIIQFRLQSFCKSPVHVCWEVSEMRMHDQSHRESRVYEIKLSWRDKGGKMLDY